MDITRCFHQTCFSVCWVLTAPWLVTIVTWVPSPSMNDPTSPEELDTCRTLQSGSRSKVRLHKSFQLCEFADMFSDKSLWARLTLRIYGCVQSWDFILYWCWEFIVMFESSWTRSLLSGWEFMDMFIVVRLRLYGHVHCCQVESLWTRSLLSGWEFMGTFIVEFSWTRSLLNVYGHVHCWVFMNTFVNEIMNMLALRGSKHFNSWEVMDVVIDTRLYRQDEEFPKRLFYFVVVLGSV